MEMLVGLETYSYTLNQQNLTLLRLQIDTQTYDTPPGSCQVGGGALPPPWESKLYILKIWNWAGEKPHK